VGGGNGFTSPAIVQSNLFASFNLRDETLKFVSIQKLVRFEIDFQGLRNSR
jgi:hypothetical protein